MTYIKTIKQLENLQKQKGIKLGLDRIEKVLAVLDNPQEKLRSIHVAGTNGKGSVCAFIASILEESGYRVGLYTSPHLLSYTERICINKKYVTEERFVKLYDKAVNAVKRAKVELTEFEVLTIMAFLYFAEAKVDIAVVEVGLGGRLDATNLVDPIVTVITNIAIDHTKILGNSLKKITEEKLGIIKSGVPLITGINQNELLRIVMEECEQQGVSAVFVEPESRERAEELAKKLGLQLKGVHQVQNASLSVAALMTVNEKIVRVNKMTIKKGLAKATLSGRFQKIQDKPATIVDGAHNGAASEALAETIKTELKGKGNFIIGILKRKNAKEIIKPLLPLAKSITTVNINDPDTISSKELSLLIKDMLKNKKSANIRSAKSIKEAMKSYKEEKNKDWIVITGSLYLAAEALKSSH